MNSSTCFERRDVMSMPTSFLTAMTSRRTALGLVPALFTVKRTLASCRSRPSAICDLAEFLHRMSTRFLSATRKFLLCMRYDNIGCLFGQRRHPPSEQERRSEGAGELRRHEARSIRGPDTASSGGGLTASCSMSRDMPHRGSGRAGEFSIVVPTARRPHARRASSAQRH